MTSTNIPPSAIREMAEEMAKMRREIDMLKAGSRASQLGFSSINDGTLVIKDGQGINRLAIGKMGDGRFGVGAANADAPPRPGSFEVIPGTAGITIRWNGEFVERKPSDFVFCDIYVSEVPMGPAWRPLVSKPVGQLLGAGDYVIAPLDPTIGYYFALVARNTSDMQSVPTYTIEPVSPTPVVADEIADGIVTRTKIAAEAVDGARIAVGAINKNHVTFTAQDLGSIATYAQDDEPTGTINIGSIWIDTNAGNKTRRWNGLEWRDATDADIALALVAAQDALSQAATAIEDAADARAIADGKIDVYYQNDPPTGASEGDWWVDLDDQNKAYRRNGNAWTPVTDARVAEALAQAQTAQSTADGKIRSFWQDTAPTTGMGTGDLWYDTANGNRASRYNGTTWTALPLGTGGLADNSVTTPKVVARSIQALQIAVETILAENLATDSVDARVIAALSIIGEHIQANVIDAGHIQAGAITADKLEAVLALVSTLIAGDPNGWRTQIGDPYTPILYWDGNQTGFALSRDPATGASSAYLSGRIEFGDGSSIEQDYIDLSPRPSTGFQKPKPRQQRTWIDSGPKNSVTARWTSATAKGSLCLVAVWQSGVGAENAPPNCGTPAGASIIDSRVSGRNRLTLFMVPNAPSSRTQETFTSSAGDARWAIAMVEYSGIAPSALDVSTWAAGSVAANGNAQSGTTPATTQAAELAFAVAGGATIGPSNGGNNQWDQPTNSFAELMESDGAAGQGIVVSTRTLTATGTYSTSWRAKKATSYIGMLATFRCAPADPVPPTPPTGVARIFTMPRGGKSTPHAVGDDGVVYPLGRVPYCKVRLTFNSALAATTDAWAQQNWVATYDPYSMFAASTGTGVWSSITIPISGLWHIDLRAIFASSTDAISNAVMYITHTARDRANTVLSGSDRFMRYGVADLSPVHCCRDVILNAGTILYWGHWSQIATTIMGSVSNQATELSARYVGPA